MSSSNPIESELYFLIAKFLSSGPCQEAASALRKEIEQNSLLPKRFDWHGNQHDTNFESIESINSHISSDHLIKICSRIGPILDKEIPPSIAGVVSLLGAGRQSLLRTKNASHNCQLRHLTARHNGAPFYPSPQSASQFPYNIVPSIITRETSGPSSLRMSLPSKSYSHSIMYRRVLGHLSPIYCVAFDRTGKYIFTGADDYLVKIWSATNGRLLATLRGHMNEISDLAVNFENTLLASASCDKHIRIWCLKTSAPVTILMGHNATITSIKFCPLTRCISGNDTAYLVSTANDGCVCFWKYDPNTNKFSQKPFKIQEKQKPGTQIICSSFSSGGIFLAVGSSDNHVRVYHVFAPVGPTKILEIEQHSDDVDSLQFSNFSTRFISGSKDGVAHIWYYERQNWHNIPLRMTDRLPGSQGINVDDDSMRKLKVSMVAWTCDDVYVITSLSDYSLKIWDSFDGKLVHVLYGHEDEVFVIEAHPKDCRIFISGGYDGRIIIWDALTGTAIKKFYNVIDGQGPAPIHDCRFSPDGLMFAATDGLGHLSFYGFGSVEAYQKIPDEIFFHTDYRPLVRDANQYVIDEQTQTAPHLMPPPFLVDIDGNPYPPSLQRLVPGRENCADQALVPYIAVHNENGVAEVLQPVQPDQPGPSGFQDRRTIDDMIERLAIEQGRNMHHDVMQEHDYVAPPTPNHQRQNQSQAQGADGSVRSPRSGRNIHRGQHGRQQSTHQQPVSNQGVRQSANWRSHDTSMNKPAWAQRIIVSPLSEFEIEKLKIKSEGFAAAEEAHFNCERKKKPLVNDATVSLRDAIKQERFTRRKRRIIQQRHGVSRGASGNIIRRPRRPNERHRNGIIDYENPEDIADSDSSDSDFVGSGAEEWKDSSSDSSSSSESESTNDSDWNTDMPSTSKKKNNKRIHDSSDNEDQDDEKENEEEDLHLPGPSCSAPSTGRVLRKVKKNKSDHQSLQDKIKMQKLEEKFKSFKELPEEFRPPEWLTECIPKKFPYFPQIGDEVVYFRQGHQSYIDAVKQKKVYNIIQSTKPYRMKKAQGTDEVFSKVVDVIYEVKPPRLVTLKLMVLNHDDNSPTGETFVVKYHDMEGVIDFIVLRQLFDTSIDRNWQIGDEFRSIIDEKWWFGTIDEQMPPNEHFPQSLFQCFKVHWASGDHEHMSPWDLEPIDEARPPANRKDSLPITSEERLSFYRPKDDEWPPCGREEECKRIASGLAKIMELGPAEPFAIPVDLDDMPIYGITIPYPIDLSSIKARVENQFYRRVDAIKFDISFIEINARKFNEPGSEIVKKAKIVKEVCIRFIESINCLDPLSIYYDVIENYQLSDHEESEESEDERDEESPVRRNPKRSKRKHSDSEASANERSSRKSRKRSRKDRVELTSSTWKSQCRDLLNLIFQNENSTPFRSPVDPIQYPNYLQLIDTPMDLTTVKEQLLADLYDNPNEFCKDMRLIFQNSKTFNTNKKSRIYSMTMNLQSFFEGRMRDITSDWRSAVSYEKKVKANKLVSKRRIPTSQLKSLPETKRKANNKVNNNNNNNRKTKNLGRKKSKKQKKRNQKPPTSPSLSPEFDQPSTSGYSNDRRMRRRILQPQQPLQQINRNTRNSSGTRNIRNKIVNNNRSKRQNNNMNNSIVKRNSRSSNGIISMPNRRYSTRRRKPVRRVFYDDTDEDDHEDDHDDDHDDVNAKVERPSTSSSMNDDENHMNSETEIDENDDELIEQTFSRRQTRRSTKNINDHMDSETEIDEIEEEEEEETDYHDVNGNDSDEDFEDELQASESQEEQSTEDESTEIDE